MLSLIIRLSIVRLPGAMKIRIDVIIDKHFGLFCRLQRNIYSQNFVRFHQRSLSRFPNFYFKLPIKERKECFPKAQNTDLRNLKSLKIKHILSRDMTVLVFLHIFNIMPGTDTKTNPSNFMGSAETKAEKWNRLKIFLKRELKQN